MSNYSLKSICKFNTVDDNDSFVGLKIIDGSPIIYLPLGYNEEDDITSLDINNLILAIKKYGKNERNYVNINDTYSLDDRFPYFSYKWIIEDYLNNGYYNELEYEEKISDNGKINWKRTISKPSEFFTKRGPVYTQFVVKKAKVNTDNLITRIHEFCVYESYNKLGWLFGNKSKAKRPAIIIDSINSSKYIAILKEELKNTFKDSKKQLLNNMITVISGVDTTKNNSKTYECGTNSFYSVWEKMIDRAYSTVKNIENYYPHGEWHINNSVTKNSALQPDTISIKGNIAYIIDSKYYSYCNTRRIDNLPTTDSIQKQITYAEYLDNNKKFKDIYNLFVLPGHIEGIIDYIGFATADWKSNDKEYHKVHSFMFDTKYLINNYDKNPINYMEKYIQSENKESI